MVQDNKQAARVVFEVWSSGQLERLDAVVAPHVVHHDPYDLHDAEGLAGMKQTIESTRQAFPDIELTVEDQIAEDDKVVTRWRGQMTHTASGKGWLRQARRSGSQASRSIASRTG